MDFLELFNKVARAVRPAHHDYVDITDMDAPLTETSLDSMDFLMCGIYLAEIYGVPDEIAKEMQPTTVRGFQEFLELHKTKDPQGTAQEIVDGVQW
jgi:hypothetical protein